MDLLLVLFLSWSCVCCGFCGSLKERFSGLTKDSEPTVEKSLQDTLSEHMMMLYSKYTTSTTTTSSSSRSSFPLRDGNTVRSFKAHPGTINNKQLQIFNLTSLTESEAILSATLHYYIGDIQNISQRCLKTKICSRHGLRRQVPVHLTIWSFASVDNRTRPLGSFVVNVSSMYRDFISWQWRDITQVLNQAKHHHHNELLIGIAINSQGHSQGQQSLKKLLSNRSPYILVYANDSAISEPESVVSTLQRHKGSLVPGLQKLGLRKHNSSTPHRTKRSADILLPLQNNELPGPEYPNEIHTWEEASPYDPVENKAAKRPRKKPRKIPRDRNPLLQFDEHTIKKARRKQWIEPRNCARRYLKVDFADIGWSEWIISPKSFDAYYCSGSCQFPMPKSLKPSNHATIQSIVRAVGVVPGIPEPCCVPEKMSSLSILFFDEDKNVVLKVYPNMTVDSCACR